ncbi:MAG: hypothetical protein A2Y40_03620 [Candidatus Margulisbacteria bacterium GWF2_35_9]|nr:MAG: hypothetical protein A2Y40_03620 [Candidatus Margulisbacteria bacterium GWF2_35_9]
MARMANVIILWHMHQPYYVNPVSDVAILPWVRLHAIKDYYDMVKILDFFPNMRVNFNLVPSLLVQIKQYVNKEITDTFLEYTKRDSHVLSERDKTFILKNFFLSKWDRLIKPYPRYQELYNKRGTMGSYEEIKEAVIHFSNQEIMDLQVWFNLSWFGAYYKQHDEGIKSLIAKGRDFTAKDKALVIEKQYEIMSLIIDKYKELQDRNQIECSTTPFYHPILPLICNTDVASESSSGIHLPEQFQHTEDARGQLIMAIKYFEEVFGKKPAGIWPAEGAVSDEAIQVIAETGISWIASDQDILRMTLQKQNKKMELSSINQFYTYEGKNNKCIDIVFRDKHISDKIGFDYKDWETDSAVDNLLATMESIVDNLEETPNMPLIPIILDGENAWEYYPNNGWDFLYKVYERLSSHRNIIPITISQYLKQNTQSKKRITSIYPGSWINNNFNIWIGHEEDNSAWDLLRKVRADLVQWQTMKEIGITISEEKRLDLAWKELYIAEGSDWNWWYGNDHSSKNDKEFDELYRQHLLNIYEILGIVAPNEVFVPIKKVSQTKPAKEISSIISPDIDGRVTDFYEWQGAGCYDTQKITDAYLEKNLINKFFYGYDESNIYLRVDFNNLLEYMSEDKDLSLIVYFLAPSQGKVRIPLAGNCSETFFYWNKGKKYELSESSSIISMFQRILELKVPIADIGAEKGSSFKFILAVEKQSKEIERWPIGNVVDFEIPKEMDLISNWIV